MKKLAFEGLQYFGGVASTLGNHIRHAMQMNSRFQDFAMTTEQYMLTIQNDSPSRARVNERDKVCQSLGLAHSPLVNLQNKLLAITKEFN